MSMEEFRSVARECLGRGDAHIPDSQLDNVVVPKELDRLWDTISAHEDEDNATV